MSTGAGAGMVTLGGDLTIDRLEWLAVARIELSDEQFEALAAAAG